MSNKVLKTTSTRRLFLVCPTDSMEHLILNHFTGDAFFYTALGIYFEYDFGVQSMLWDLICEHRIEKVVFVTAMNNVFYEQVFNKSVKHNYPVDKALAEANEKISKHRINPEVFFSNYYSLVARHVENQKHRLLHTSSLGSHLREDRIIVDAYVYQPDKKQFSSHRDIEKMGYLLNSISYN